MFTKRSYEQVVHRSYEQKTKCWRVRQSEEGSRLKMLSVHPHHGCCLTRQVPPALWGLLKIPAYAVSCVFTEVILDLNKCQNELMPVNFLICSNVSQNVIDQGAILAQVGRNPLYIDNNPSLFIVCFKQSYVDMYSKPLPCLSLV